MYIKHKIYIEKIYKQLPRDEITYYKDRPELNNYITLILDGTYVCYNVIIASMVNENAKKVQ